MTAEENIALAKRNIVDSVWKEANLEGIAVTFLETQEIIDGRIVAGLTIKETLAINNLKHAWGFILDTIDVAIDLRYVREVNALVGAQGVVLDAGKLRDYDVKIGGTEWAPAISTVESVSSELAIIQAVKNETERGLRFFGHICRGQWFADGNKRTAQLVANASLIRCGRGILAIASKDQFEARTLLIDYYETGDFQSLGTMLVDRAIEGIQRR